MKTRTNSLKIRVRTTSLKVSSRVFMSLGDKNRAVPDVEVLTESMTGSRIIPYVDPAYITYLYAHEAVPFQ